MGYSLNAELFAEYGIGLIVIGTRVYARWRSGLDNFYWDDVFLALATIFWTLDTVFLYLLDIYGSNIGLDDKTAMEVPDEDIPRLRKGAIFAYIAWIAYICMVWSFKGVLFKNLWQHRVMLMVTCFCICTFLASILLDLCLCTPAHKVWQVKPYPGDNCTKRPLNYIIIEVLNIVTDMGILTVPIPLVLAAQIPRSQKFILGLLFGSGFFIMIASALRAYYSVSNISQLTVALGWASRESLVSAIVVSAPGIRPLLSRLRCFQLSSRRTPNSGGILHSKSGNFTSISAQDRKTPLELRRFRMKNSISNSKHDGSGESDQHVMLDSSNSSSNNNAPLGSILVTTEYATHVNGKSAGGSTAV